MIVGIVDDSTSLSPTWICCVPAVGAATVCDWICDATASLCFYIVIKPSGGSCWMGPQSISVLNKSWMYHKKIWNVHSRMKYCTDINYALVGGWWPQQSVSVWSDLCWQLPGLEAIITCHMRDAVDATQLMWVVATGSETGSRLLLCLIVGFLKALGCPLLELGYWARWTFWLILHYGGEVYQLLLAMTAKWSLPIQR